MDTAFSRNSFTARVPTVEKFARLFVGIMTSPESNEDSAFGSVTGVEGDDLSFIVHVHRKTVRFEFAHVLLAGQGGKVLAGRYSVFLVDKKGEWLPEKDSLIVWSDDSGTQIRFGNDDFSPVSVSPSPYEIGQIRERVKRMALTIALADLPVLNF